MIEQLNYMMAEMESWGSSIEYGIPKEHWADYKVRDRSDDLYIATFSAVFDVLESEGNPENCHELADLARTLLVFSNSDTPEFTNGINKTLNLLYSASAYYLSDFPITASVVVKKITESKELLSEEYFFPEEYFLYSFLSQHTAKETTLFHKLSKFYNTANFKQLENLIQEITDRKDYGLSHGPRLYIASELAYQCIKKFEKSNFWYNIRENSESFEFDNWAPLLHNRKTPYIGEFLPSQIAVLKSGILNDHTGFNSMLMPAKSGKTTLCEILIFNEVKINKKIVLYLSPISAYTIESRRVYRNLIESGLKVINIVGGNHFVESIVSIIEGYDLLVMTPDQLNLHIQINPNFISKFDTIICDAGHVVDNVESGLFYDLILTKLSKIATQHIKVIFMSEYLPNMENFHSWLGGNSEKITVSNYKPIQNDFSFLVSKNEGNSWQLQFNTIYEHPRNYFIDKFLVRNDFRYHKASKNDELIFELDNDYLALTCATALKACKIEPVAIYTTSIYTLTNLAEIFIFLFGNQIKVTQDNFPNFDEFANSRLRGFTSFYLGNEHLLTQLLRYGIGFLHSELPLEIRNEMTTAIQNKSVKILICTGSIVAEVNFPINTVIVHTIESFGNKETSDIVNRRITKLVDQGAGRVGKDTRGKVIFINDNEKEYVENVLNSNSVIEPVYGAFYRLVKKLYDFIVQRNLKFNNAVFESLENNMLPVVDKIDIAIISLIPTEVLIEENGFDILQIVDQIYALQHYEMDSIRGIERIISLRTEHIENSVQSQHIRLLKVSGSSPRFWNFVYSNELIERPEWRNLQEILNEQWIENIVLRLLELPTVDNKFEKNLVKQALIGWMRGQTYHEISNACQLGIYDTSKLINHTLLTELQQYLRLLNKLIISQVRDPSEIAKKSSSLLLYGLGDLQQLDLFERVTNDRLAIWGISRFLTENGIDKRGTQLIDHLRENKNAVFRNLQNDSRVPSLSKERFARVLNLV